MLLFSGFYISADSHVPGHRAQSLPGARERVGPAREEASSLLPRRLARVSPGWPPPRQETAGLIKPCLALTTAWITLSKREFIFEYYKKKSVHTGWPMRRPPRGSVEIPGQLDLHGSANTAGSDAEE